MKAIIPVAGIGTRLRPHTHTYPKVLLPVAGKPIVGHILDDLVGLGFKEITFIVGYKGDMIRDYVDSAYKGKFAAHYVEQGQMLGLGHAVSLAKPFHYGDDDALIVLGDTIFSADLAGVFSRGQTALGVREVADARRFGVVELDPAGRVTRLIEKPDKPPTNLAIVGIYYIRRPAVLFDCLDELMGEGKTTKGEFQLTDALQKFLDRGQPMQVFKIDGWYDCGKAETMLLTNRDLLDAARDAAAEAAVAARYPKAVIVPPVALAADTVIENAVVGPHVSVSGGSTLRDCVVKNSIIGSNSEVSSIVLDASLVGDNARVAGARSALNIGDSSEIVLEGPPSE